MIRPDRLCLLAISLFYASAFAQDLTPEMRAEVERRVKIQRSWDGRMNSPGAELHAVEVDRASAGKGTVVVKFELHAKGLPTDLDYELLMLPTMATNGNELQSTGGVQIDKRDGRVIDGPGDPRYLIFPDPAPGEPFRMALVATAGTYRAFVTILPKPIEASDKGCKVSVVRLTPKFELAFVEATGFPAQTDIAVRGNSEGEVHDFKMTTNANGYADAGVLPAKLGKTKGKMEMQFTASACAPKVTFKWGSTADGLPYQ